MRRVARWASALLAFLAVAPAAADETIRLATDTPVPVDARTVRGTLDNGLRWIVHPTAQPSDVLELRLVVAAGSVHEDDDQRGAAHFVEHMAFNQTRRFSPGELRRFLEASGARFGADFNATTDFRHTTYELSVPADDARLRGQAFEILADWASGIVFDPAEVEQERGVVLAELEQKRATSLGDLLEWMPALLVGNRYGERLPIGTRASLERLQADDLERFFDTWYRPDRMTVVAVGDLDPGDFERRLRRHLGRLRNRGTTPTDHWPIPALDHPAIQAIESPSASRAGVLVLYLVPEPRSEVGAGPSIVDLRQHLLDRLVAQSLAQALFEDAEGVGILGPGVVPATPFAWQSRRWLDVEDLVETLERVRRHGLPSELVESARRGLLAELRSFVTRSPTARRLADRYAAQAVGASSPADSVQGEIAVGLVEGLSVEELGRRAREVLDPRNRRIVVLPGTGEGQQVSDVVALLERVAARRDLQPLENRWSWHGATEAGTGVRDPGSRDPDDPEDDATSDSDRGSAVAGAVVVPSPEIPEATYFPEIDLHLWRLANGTHVLFKRTRDPMARAVGWRAGGVAALAPEKRATALLLSPRVPAPLLRSGDTTQRSRLVLHPLGAAIEVDLQGSQLGLLFTPFDGVEPGLQRSVEGVVRDAVVQQLRRDAVTNSVRLHEKLSSSLFERLSLATHPPFRPLADQLPEIDLQAAPRILSPFFEDLGELVVVVAGDFEPRAVAQGAQEVFGASSGGSSRQRSMLAWPSGHERGIEGRPGRPRSPRGPTPTVRIAGKGQQSWVQRLSLFELPWTPEDGRELWLVSQVLQVFAREHLRDSLGLTYQITVRAWAPLEGEGPAGITIAFETEPRHVEQALEGLDEAVGFLLTRPIGESPFRPRLEQALAAVAARTLPPATEGSSGFWVENLLGAYRSGVDPHRIEEAWSRGGAMTEERLRYLAKQWLGPERSVLGVTRPAKDD